MAVTDKVYLKNCLKTLTREDVEIMAEEFKTRTGSREYGRRWVEDQLEQYEASIEKGGAKLKNKQLIPRRNLMRKILELWPEEAAEPSAGTESVPGEARGFPVPPPVSDSEEENE